MDRESISTQLSDLLSTGSQEVWYAGTNVDGETMVITGDSAVWMFGTDGLWQSRTANPQGPRTPITRETAANYANYHRFCTQIPSSGTNTVSQPPIESTVGSAPQRPRGRGWVVTIQTEGGARVQTDGTITNNLRQLFRWRRARTGAAEERENRPTEPELEGTARAELEGTGGAIEAPGDNDRVELPADGAVSELPSENPASELPRTPASSSRRSRLSRFTGSLRRASNK